MSGDFRDVFFEEAAEHLQEIENQLLTLDANPEDDEALNSVFRAAHSIKGSAGMFGFDRLSAFTHHLETLLDAIRHGDLRLTDDHVDLTLRSVDVIRASIDHLAEGGDDETGDDELVAALQQEVARVGDDGSQAEESQSDDSFGFFDDAETGPEEDDSFGLFDEPEQSGSEAEDDSFGLFDEEESEAVDATPGEATVAKEGEDFGLFETEETPSDASGETYQDYLDAMLKGDDAQGAPDEQAATGEPQAASPQTDDGSEGKAQETAPETGKTRSSETAASGGGDEIERDGRFGWLNRPEGREGGAASKPSSPKKPSPEKSGKGKARGGSEGSLRVSLEKIDQLVNQISELVITQAMLKETGRHLDPAQHEQHLNTLETLERNTRELQESVLSVRLLPVSFLFSRFPRVVRDLSRQLGKKVELTQLGEHTELDKSLIEKLSDPLTHLVRNSIDHGIETPEERAARGKPETGQVVMSAAHEGGNIVLEISDDGAGLSRDGILKKARENGLDVSDDWPDDRVWNLIFEPGFSTAAAVTDVSGRGVGMDVVRRNIKELGGNIDVESHPGQGSRFVVRLPLTLAITEGMVVRVGGGNYVLPLDSVVESLQLSDSEVFQVQGQSRVIQRHGDYITLTDLGDQLEESSADDSQPLVAVVVESEGRQVALTVDELLGQQQIVIKNLEANYKQVPGFSGATVMGDGTVALILDVAHFAANAAQTFQGTQSKSMTEMGAEQ